MTTPSTDTRCCGICRPLFGSPDDVDCHNPSCLCHTEPKEWEEVRRKVEKVLWKHYNEGAYAMNGEEVSKEIMEIVIDVISRSFADDPRPHKLK